MIHLNLDHHVQRACVYMLDTASMTRRYYVIGLIFCSFFIVESIVWSLYTTSTLAYWTSACVAGKCCWRYGKFVNSGAFRGP